MGPQIPCPYADLARIERSPKRFEVGRGRPRLFANTGVGRFAFVLFLRHVHIHRAMACLDCSRDWGTAAGLHMWPMRILASGPLESSVGLTRFLTPPSRHWSERSRRAGLTRLVRRCRGLVQIANGWLISQANTDFGASRPWVALIRVAPDRLTRSISRWYFEGSAGAQMRIRSQSSDRHAPPVPAG